MPQSDKAVRINGVGQSVRIHQAIRSDVSNLYGAIVKPTDNPVDSLAFKRGDGGVWLCVAKRFNSDTGNREVIFGHGSDFIEALVSANAMIAASRWTIEKPWAGRS
jgi:hypothetical protein